MPTLRPYQVEAVEGCFRELAERRSTLVVMPTGTGKSVVFSSVARRWRDERRGRVLLLAHREELIKQAKQHFERAGLSAQIEMADERAAGGLFGSDVVVGSVQTLARPQRREAFHPNSFGLVIVDEAHHAPSDSYRAILDHFAPAKVLGVTATPDRQDGSAMGRVFESVAFVYEIRDAIERRYLVPIRQKAVQVEGLDLSRVRTTAGDLNEGDLEEVLNEEENLHGVAHPTVELAGDRPTMVFATSVEHAHRLAAVMARRVGAEQVCALDGTMDRDYRAQRLADFAAGGFQFLVNCLDEQTEILTKRGWLGIDEMREGDVTASIHPENGRLEWTDVFHVVRRPRAATERMVRIENQTLDIRVTEGHRMLTRAPGSTYWHIEGAYTLPERVGKYELPMAGFGRPDEDAPGVPEGTTPAHALTLDECKFIGLWMADGHLDRSGAARGIQIGQSARYVAANAEIRRLLVSCGFDYSVDERRVSRSPHVQYVYRIPKGNIGGQLKRRGFARLEHYLDKHFNPALFGLNRDQALALIEGLWLGDGIKEAGRKLRNDTRTSWKICNTDKVMLDRVQRLAVTRGLAANLHGPKDNGPLATKPVYHLAIRDRSAVITNNHQIGTSGGNPAQFEQMWVAERVWCVSNRLGTIITRRNGHVVAMGQCALFLEGFDSPRIACVAMARPTKSRALYAQAVGRGTRLHPGKHDLLVLDFEGNAGKHSLVCALDILDGNQDAEVRERARKLQAEDPQLDILGALDAAARQLADEQRRKIVAAARYKAVDVDPFAVLGVHARAGRWGGAPPSEKQLAVLERAGIKIDPEKTDRGQVSQLIDGIVERSRKGLCTYKQAKLLLARGLNPDVTFEEARRAIDAIAANRWRVPDWLRAELGAPKRQEAAS